MLDRTSPPPSYEVEKFQLPNYETYCVSDRVNIYSIVDHKLPLLQIELVFESGKASQIIPGSSYYAIKALAEGTKSKTANDISFGFESLGSFIEWGSGLEHSFIKVYCQSDKALSTLELLEEVVTQPSFPEKNFNLIKKIRSQQIKQQEAKNSQYATALFNKILFGANHPLGQIFSSAEALESNLKDVKRFYDEILFNNPTVFVTGDVSERLIQRIERLLNNLPQQRKSIQEFQPEPLLKSSTIKKAASEQVSFRTGMFTVSKNDPQVHKLGIANSLFGGFFGSRLMQKVREELGYTYSIYSTFVHTKRHSYWMIGSELIKEHFNHGVSAIEAELEKLGSTIPPTEEVKKLKSYLKGTLLSSMDSIFSQGSILKGLKLSALPDSYYDDYFSAIDGISEEEISTITKEHLLEPKKSTLLYG